MRLGVGGFGRQRAAGTMLMKLLAASVVAEIGCADLKDCFGTAAQPELLGALDPLVELLDERFDRGAGYGQALPAIIRVVHAIDVLPDISQA